MPINLTNYDIDYLCWGNTWEIADENLLIELVAKVLLGRQHHVAKILQGLNVGNSSSFTENAKNDAIEKLTVLPHQTPYHRDGLIFQIFSWIVAHKASGNNSLIRLPHLIPAHKGFDGLQIKLNMASGDVEAVIIFEDKATENPRQTIREKVWPEFKVFEEGERESELMQETVGLLTQRPDLVPDIEGAIDKLIWNKVRSYRVSITGESQHIPDDGLQSLFEGYEKVVQSNNNIKRQGEVIHIPSLREWMEQFSLKVIAYLNT